LACVAAGASTVVDAAALDGGQGSARGATAAGSFPAAFAHDDGTGACTGESLRASGEEERAAIKAAPTRQTRTVSLLDRAGGAAGSAASDAMAGGVGDDDAALSILAGVAAARRGAATSAGEEA
jgi:hypothetical protein